MTEEKKDPGNVTKSVAENGTKESARGGRHARVIVAVVAVVVVLGGVGGYARAVQSAYSSYESRVKAAQNADARLVERLAVAGKLLGATKESDVLDVSVLGALPGNVKAGEALKGVPEQPVNRWLLWDVPKARSVVDTDVRDADAAVTGIDKAMGRVESSKTAKQVKGARETLSKSVESAEKTYKDSDGKVADNRTREALKTAIDKAKKTAADDKAGVKALEDADTTLAKAVKKVNDSITSDNINPDGSGTLEELAKTLEVLAKIVPFISALAAIISAFYGLPKAFHDFSDISRRRTEFEELEKLEACLDDVDKTAFELQRKLLAHKTREGLTRKIYVRQGMSEQVIQKKIRWGFASYILIGLESGMSIGTFLLVLAACPNGEKDAKALFESFVSFSVFVVLIAITSNVGRWIRARMMLNRQFDCDVRQLCKEGENCPQETLQKRMDDSFKKLIAGQNQYKWKKIPGILFTLLLGLYVVDWLAFVFFDRLIPIKKILFFPDIVNWFKLSRENVFGFIGGNVPLYMSWAFSATVLIGFLSYARAKWLGKSPMTVWYRPDPSWDTVRIHYQVNDGEWAKHRMMTQSRGGWWKFEIPHAAVNQVQMAFTNNGSNWDSRYGENYRACGGSVAVAGGQFIPDVRPNNVLKKNSKKSGKGSMTVWYRPDPSWDTVRIHYQVNDGEWAKGSMVKSLGGWRKFKIQHAAGNQVQMAFSTNDDFDWDSRYGKNYRACGGSVAVAGGQFIPDVRPNNVPRGISNVVGGISNVANSPKTANNDKNRVDRKAKVKDLSVPDDSPAKSVLAVNDSINVKVRSDVNKTVQSQAQLQTSKESTVAEIGRCD